MLCGQPLTCVDGMQYPTTCGPSNCDNPIGPCEPTPPFVCTDKKCGELCGRSMICDGKGKCVDVLTNPCIEHGCEGKKCGDECIEGDMKGVCDRSGKCAQFVGPPNCEEFCTLPSGENVAVGWSGPGEGKDWCNTCTCGAADTIACTKKLCPEFCTFPSGEKVAVGWSAPGEGKDWCNTCTCGAADTIACTKKLCPEFCTFPSGEKVAVGWSG